MADVDIDEQMIVSGPDLISRGFVYARENEDLIDAMREVVRDAIEESLASGSTEWMELKSDVKDSLSKFVYSKTKRRPMILPVITSL